jgi:hypothetical protein
MLMKTTEFEKLKLSFFTSSIQCWASEHCDCRFKLSLGADVYVCFTVLFQDSRGIKMYTCRKISPSFVDRYKYTRW